MKTPVFSFQEERLTNAPWEKVLARLGHPESLQCLQACPGLCPLEHQGDQRLLRWRHGCLGTLEEGTLRVSPHPLGAHLQVEGRLRGWGAFLLLGWMRWRTDHLLDRFVQEL